MMLPSNLLCGLLTGEQGFRKSHCYSDCTVLLKAMRGIMSAFIIHKLYQKAASVNAKINKVALEKEIMEKSSPLI